MKRLPWENHFLSSKVVKHMTMIVTQEIEPIIDIFNRFK